MATQTLSAIRAPPSQYPRRFKPPLTPPYHNDPKPDGPWSGQGGQGGSDDNYYVSVPPAGEPRSERTTPQMSPIQFYPPMKPPYRIPPEAPSNPPVSLPPLRYFPRTPPTPSDRRYGNLFGAHSILNPQAELVEHHARPFQPPERPPVGSLYSEKEIRTHNLSRLNPPTGTVDAQQSLFLTSSSRPSKPMAIRPALPTPSAHTRTHYFPPTATTRPPKTMGTEFLQPRIIDMAPSNQSNVQFMTIQSQDGSLHNIQVETQTASKGAGEKRRRNAGASARFRARRKEKEREVSMSISRLEQNVRDSNEDAKYYRAERDYWRSIAMQAHPERHITRPPSPRLGRVSVGPHAHHCYDQLGARPTLTAKTGQGRSL